MSEKSPYLFVLRPSFLWTSNTRLKHIRLIWLMLIWTFPAHFLHCNSYSTTSSHMPRKDILERTTQKENVASSSKGDLVSWIHTFRNQNQNRNKCWPHFHLQNVQVSRNHTRGHWCLEGPPHSNQWKKSQASLFSEGFLRYMWVPQNLPDPASDWPHNTWTWSQYAGCPTRGKSCITFNRSLCH